MWLHKAIALYPVAFASIKVSIIIVVERIIMNIRKCFSIAIIGLSFIGMSQQAPLQAQEPSLFYRALCTTGRALMWLPKRIATKQITKIMVTPKKSISGAIVGLAAIKLAPYFFGSTATEFAANNADWVGPNFVRIVQEIAQKYKLDPDSLRFTCPPIPIGPAVIGNLVLLPRFYWWENLPEDQRRAILGHEFFHIKDYHHYKYVAVHSSVSLLSYYGLLYGAKHLFQYDLTNAKIGSYALGITSFLLAGFAFSYVQRRLEKKADIEAAKQLECAQDLIDSLQELSERQKQLPQWLRLLSKLKKPIKFVSHPTLEQRIAYLTPLVSQQT